MQRGSSVIHWFQAGYRGLVVSLCHTAKEHPRFITPPQPGEGTACRSCLKVIAAHGTDNPMLRARDPRTGEPYLAEILRRRFKTYVAEFLNDPDPERGPELHVCPICRNAYEGYVPPNAPYLCEGTETEPHKPVEVIELARKNPIPRGV
jgi:hypothetical protein